MLIDLRQFLSSTTKKMHTDAGMAGVLILLLLGYFTSDTRFFYWAIPVLVLTMSIPVLLSPFTLLWMTFSKVLGIIMSTLILGIIYLVLVVPVGVVRRALDYDQLKLNSFKHSPGSVMFVRNHTFTASDMEKPF